MTATNKQIRDEAQRRVATDPEIAFVDACIEVTREGWTPPEPVDPVLLAFREWVKKIRSGPAVILDSDIDAGGYDSRLEGHAYLAGARMAREQERERAKGLVEYMGDRERLGSIHARNLLAKYRGEA
jgi:hypothetical protein